MPHEKKSPTSELIKYYNEGFSCEVIGDMFSMSRQAVWERLKRNGIDLRKKKIYPFVVYDGIKFTPSGNGYYRATSRKGHVSLHRYKYKKEVGDIPPNFDVHHKDRNKQNNDISNLECISKSDHSRIYKHGKNQHNKDKKGTSALGMVGQLM